MKKLSAIGSCAPSASRPFLVGNPAWKVTSPSPVASITTAGRIACSPLLLCRITPSIRPSRQSTSATRVCTCRSTPAASACSWSTNLSTSWSKGRASRSPYGL